MSKLNRTRKALLLWGLKTWGLKTMHSAMTTLTTAMPIASAKKYVALLSMLSVCSVDVSTRFFPCSAICKRYRNTPRLIESSMPTQEIMLR